MIDALDGQDQHVIALLDVQMVASAWQGDEPVHYGSRVTVNVEVGEDHLGTIAFTTAAQRNFTSSIAVALVESRW